MCSITPIHTHFDHAVDPVQAYSSPSRQTRSPSPHSGHFGVAPNNIPAAHRSINFWTPPWVGWLLSSSIYLHVVVSQSVKKMLLILIFFYLKVSLSTFFSLSFKSHNNLFSSARVLLYSSSSLSSSFNFCFFTTLPSNSSSAGRFLSC